MRNPAHSIPKKPRDYAASLSLRGLCFGPRLPGCAQVGEAHPGAHPVILSDRAIFATGQGVAGPRQTARAASLECYERGCASILTQSPGSDYEAGARTTLG
jgi:hypothetical protein